MHQVGLGYDAVMCRFYTLSEFVDCVEGEVGQILPLDGRPQELDWVELRRVRWKPLDTEPRLGIDVLRNLSTPVSRKPVPYQDDWSFNLFVKRLDEVNC